MCGSIIQPHYHYIKNILLRNVVVTVKQRIQEIVDMIPHAKVQMCWILGEENSIDPVSKLFMDPFRQANINLFRFGPTYFRTNEDKYVFLEITKSHETYKQLPDEVFRVQRKKRK